MNQVTANFVADNVVNFFFDESLRKNIGGCATEAGLRAYLKRLVVGEIETAKRMESSAKRDHGFSGGFHAEIIKRIQELNVRPGPDQEASARNV